MICALWNAAANDTSSLSPVRPQREAMGMANAGWMWHMGQADVSSAVNTVEGKANKHRFD
eukprot:CAMPEP_0180178766 /NCGR_PEP_ID=MMETSP0986-20121125/38632_1 /TAXON_ID=697907 /ORGANISM="non described non described, Strain CCMP2293" /LENGTH=59 /DNA_ID=CAMNT_0022131739 /DNA_START=324 /DNA_END=503 /DNA_ORIENTATION=-